MVAWEERLKLSSDNAIECVVHSCDAFNKRGFARPYVLSEHTLVLNLPIRNSSSWHRGPRTYTILHTTRAIMTIL